jgi:hypothetical protein
MNVACRSPTGSRYAQKVVNAVMPRKNLSHEERRKKKKRKITLSSNVELGTPSYADWKPPPLYIENRK